MLSVVVSKGMNKVKMAMTVKRFLTKILIALSLLLGGAAPAMAQDAGANQTFKDWVVRCVPRDGLPPCDMVQSVFNADTEQRLLQMSVAHLGRDDQVGIQIWVPTGVLVSSGVLFEIDGKERVLGALQYTRCEADGCLVEAIVPANDLKPLRAGRKGAFAVLGSDGQPRVIAVSLSGFSAALKAVGAKNKEWFSTTN